MLRIHSFIIETLRKVVPVVRAIGKHDPDLAPHETRACLDVAEVFGYVDVDAQLRDDLDRIAATLFRLIE